LEESSKEKNNKDCEKEKTKISKAAIKKVNDIEPNLDVKLETPELDEEFHDALFLDEEDDNLQENTNTVQEKMNTVKEKNNIINEVNFKKYKEVSNIDTTIEDVVKNTSKTFYKNSYKMSIYFNKDCYPGGHVVKRKIPKLPNSIGPGIVSSILQEAITIFVDLDYFPWSALKKIKKIQNMLFNGPGGVEMLIKTK